MSIFNNTNNSQFSELPRQWRTRILVDGNPDLASQVSALFEKFCDVRLVSEPREVLVMNKVREPAKNSLFYLGEALLTECKAEITVKKEADSVGAAQSSLGIGMILGSQHTRARDLAIIDAAFCLSEPLPAQLLEAFKQAISLLENEAMRLEEQSKKQCDKLEATRVEFASMFTEFDIEEGHNG